MNTNKAALTNQKKQSAFCTLVYNASINDAIFRLDFVWPGHAPKAGQFFLIKPKRSGIFLGRPIAAALWDKGGTIRFLIEKVGKGTEELSAMQLGEEAELVGPLGNAWTDYLPLTQNSKPIALVGGSLGIAPLNALLCEELRCNLDVYAGFKTGFKSPEEEVALLGPAMIMAQNLLIVTEDGKSGQKGFITDFFVPEKYSVVCACGPKPMMKAVVDKCKTAGVPCFISMDQRMACGVGVCLGCTVETVHGNKRCCTDGPIFNAQELLFND